MKRLTFLGPMVPYSSYGMLAIQFIRNLQKMAKCHVAVRATQTDSRYANIPDDMKQLMVNGPQPEEWELLLHPPNIMPTPGKKTAFFTMWEATKLPPFGVQFLNKADVVIVPTDWNASCFSACGVTKPIRVVPLGINSEIWRPRTPPPTQAQDVHWRGTVFGTAGRLAHGGCRKGVREVIDLFKKAFPAGNILPWVKLKVKCFEDCGVRSDDLRVEIYTDFKKEEEMANWFASLDCYVSAAKSEGWGLNQHQAMAIGRPVISTLFGGVTQFMNRDNCIPIPHKLAPVTGIYEGCGHWAEPDEAIMIAAMQYVASNPIHFHEIGIDAARSVLHFTEENTAMKLISVLEEFGAL